MKAAGVVGAITLLSRVLGLVRDAVIAATLGAGYLSDCFNIAFEIPNLARRVLGEGALSAFIVPVYTQRRLEQSDEMGWRFVSNALNTFTLLTMILTAVGMFFSKELFLFFGGAKFYFEGETEYLELGVRLTRIMFPFLICLAAASLLMGVLHSHRHFSTPSLGSVTINITIIAASLIWAGSTQRRFAFILSWAVVVGGVMRVAIMIPPLLSHGFRYMPVIDLKSPAMRSLFRMMIPATMGLAVVHINISVDATFANFLGPGRITYLKNANRLTQFPLALFATAISTAILPQLTSFLLENKRRQLEETLSFAFRVLMIIFIPVTVGTIVLGRPIVELLLQRGRWGAEATLGTYYGIMFYSLEMVPIAFIRVLTPLYYARKDVMTPFKAGIIALVSNIILNALFVFVILKPLEHGGLALASSISACINFYYLYRKERDVFGEVFTREVRKTFYSSLGASLLMGMCAWGTMKGLHMLAVPGTFAARAVYLGLSMGISGAAYFVFGRMLKVPEFDQALRLVTRRFRSRPA